jgi:hypothetical protein
MYTYKGILTYKGETQTKGVKNYPVREFAVSPDPTAKWVREVKFELSGDDVSLIDNINERDEVTVVFFLNGRKYNDKYYTTITATSITKVQENKDLPF